MTLWIGLDVGQRETHLAVVEAGGRVLAEARRPSEARSIIDFALTHSPDRSALIGCEAGNGVHLVRELHADGWTVLMFDARRVSRFLEANRIKSDITDARGIAEYVRLHQSAGRSVFVKSLPFQNLRTELMLRRKLSLQAQALDRTLRSVVRLHGGDLPPSREMTRSKHLLNREMRRLVDDGLNTDEVIRPVIAIREAIRAHLAVVDRRLTRFAKGHPVCKRLMTIPGVGPITALAFFSSVEDPTRFKTLASIGPYLGLTPHLRQSGQMRYQGHITRRGDALTRTYLVVAATTLLHRDLGPSELRSWATALKLWIGVEKGPR